MYIHFPPFMISAYDWVPTRAYGRISRGKHIYEYDENKYFPINQRQKITRQVSYAYLATEEALTRARWKPTDID